MQDKGVFSHAICGIYYIFFYSPPLAAKTEEKVRGNVFKVMNFIKMLCLIPYNALATLSTCETESSYTTFLLGNSSKKGHILHRVYRESDVAPPRDPPFLPFFYLISKQQPSSFPLSKAVLLSKSNARGYGRVVLCVPRRITREGGGYGKGMKGKKTLVQPLGSKRRKDGAEEEEEK